MFMQIPFHGDFFSTTNSSLNCIFSLGPPSSHTPSALVAPVMSNCWVRHSAHAHGSLLIYNYHVSFYDNLPLLSEIKERVSWVVFRLLTREQALFAKYDKIQNIFKKVLLVGTARACPTGGGASLSWLRGYTILPWLGGGVYPILTWLGYPPGRHIWSVEVLWDGDEVHPQKGHGTSWSIMGWRWDTVPPLTDRPLWKHSLPPHPSVIKYTQQIFIFSFFSNWSKITWCLKPANPNIRQYKVDFYCPVTSTDGLRQYF